MKKHSDPTYEYAVELAHRFIITDGHIDLPWRLSESNFRLSRECLGIPVQSNKGDFDYVRAKAGGLDAPFMAIFIPARFQDDLTEAKVKADSLIDMVMGIIEAHPDKFARGDAPEMIEGNFRKGLISLPLGLENGAALETLDDVAYFYNRGIRYITLTHGKDNHICDSSYDTALTWNGLSPFGEKLVRKMNEVGMMIDVSHISDKAFYQVMEQSKAPVIASHSSCRAFTPGWERNMDDDMIRLLGKKGGIIQINFGSDFLDAEISKGRAEHRKQLQQILKAAGLEATDEEAIPLVKAFKKENPDLYADVKKVADHIDHVNKLTGIDHIGLGSDFDGVGDSLPMGLKDVSQYPNLIFELLVRGYQEEDIEKICYKNVWRVWHQVNEEAQSK